MITHDQLLPSVWQMQRTGRIGRVAVSASRYSTLAALAESATLREAFPGRSFEWWPAHDGPPQPELYREAISSLPPGNIVMVAVPDQLHHGTSCWPASNARFFGNVKSGCGEIRWCCCYDQAQADRDGGAGHRGPPVEIRRSR